MALQPWVTNSVEIDYNFYKLYTCMTLCDLYADTFQCMERHVQLNIMNDKININECFVH